MNEGEMNMESHPRQGRRMWARSVLTLTNGPGRMLRAWVLLATMCLIGSILIGALVPGWPWDKLITEDPVGGIIMFVVFGGLLFFDRSKARRILGGEEAGAAESSSAPPPSDAGGIPPGLGAG